MPDLGTPDTSRHTSPLTRVTRVTTLYSQLQVTPQPFPLLPLPVCCRQAAANDLRSWRGGKTPNKRAAFKATAPHTIAARLCKHGARAASRSAAETSTAWFEARRGDSLNTRRWSEWHLLASVAVIFVKSDRPTDYLGSACNMEIIARRFKVRLFCSPGT